MEQTRIGAVRFDIDPEALKAIIQEGRLAEFATKAGALAATQINAQIVDLVSRAALGEAIKGGLSVQFDTVFEGGDFGTTGGPHGPHGPRPRPGVIFAETALSRAVAAASVVTQGAERAG